MKVLNLFEKSVVSIAVLTTFCGANAATSPRASMLQHASDSASVRMPTMPTVSLNTIGNPAVTTINQPAEVYTYHNDIKPQPQPDPQPTPTTGCPDGGVKDSAYTITSCMNDVRLCINTGALPGGLNDLFNEDVRNAIANGMQLCQASVDKCIKEVRVNCRNVYNETADVWMDFNSRIVQPEYYNFVLRKTGLTPNQAENTCLLLDRNTYGSSFTAVSDTNAVNSEYNKNVGAYNRANGNSLSKDNPQGVAVNITGYDGNRGHYARWDAANAECLVRVAAYNKDKLITNSWLFGAVGNDNPAEVWEKTGSTFSCSKNLFDFSLLNDTKTTAVVGVGGGTVLGSAIGAAAGAGSYNKKHNEYLDSVNKANDPCTDENYRKQLGAKIYASNRGGVLRSYAYENIFYSTDSNGAVTFTGTPVFEEGYNFNELSEEKCRALHVLNEKVYLYESLVNQCLANNQNKVISDALSANTIRESSAYLVEKISVNGNTLSAGATLTCDKPSSVTEQNVITYNNECMFVPLQIQSYLDTGKGPTCSSGDKCLTVAQTQYQIGQLKSLFDMLAIKTSVGKDANKGAEIGKGVAIGAASGAAAGGLATAITAFVEKSNITCKVGDGLYSVALGKSHTIDSLKDIYVKWNLNLPDIVSPTSAVLDKASWEQACSQFNNKMADCPKVQINFKTKGKYELIQSACKTSGSICIINDAVASSHGIDK